VHFLAVTCQDGCIRCIVFQYSPESGFDHINYEERIVVYIYNNLRMINENHRKNKMMNIKEEQRQTTN
jgi:hypothetical protein